MGYSTREISEYDICGMGEKDVSISCYEGTCAAYLSIKKFRKLVDRIDNGCGIKLEVRDDGHYVVSRKNLHGTNYPLHFATFTLKN